MSTLRELIERDREATNNWYARVERTAFERNHLNNELLESRLTVDAALDNLEAYAALGRRAAVGDAAPRDNGMPRGWIVEICRSGLWSTLASGALPPDTLAGDHIRAILTDDPNIEIPRATFMDAIRAKDKAEYDAALRDDTSDTGETMTNETIEITPDWNGKLYRHEDKTIGISGGYPVAEMAHIPKSLYDRLVAAAEVGYAVAAMPDGYCLYRYKPERFIYGYGSDVDISPVGEGATARDAMSIDKPQDVNGGK